MKNSVVDQCGGINQCTGQDNKVGIGIKCRSRGIRINEVSAGEAQKLNSVIDDSCMYRSSTESLSIDYGGRTKRG